MFKRRHPFLYFFIVISVCFTIVFLSFIGLFVFGSNIMLSKFDQKHMLHNGNIGIVEINGLILSSKKIIEDIKTFEERDNIKAIVLRINSPGGGIGPSQEIFRQIGKTNKVIISSLGSVAASGGYYIAAATKKIIANPGTITGSIGVIMEYPNIMEVAKKIGIYPVVIKSGEFKDLGSPLRKITESEKKILQSLVNELHLQFVADASKARNIDIKKLALLADGRIYSGKKAVELKLVDHLGNLDDAVKWAGKLANVKEELKPVYLDDTMSFVKRFVKSLLKDINISSTISDNFRYIIN